MLFSEKEHGLQRLNGSLESGEKLYPDTASTGREKVRQDLRRAKEDWERLFSGLNEAQRRVDAFLMQWTSYVDGQDSLTRWMSDTEAALRADMDLRNTLQEKRQQLQNYRVSDVNALLILECFGDNDCRICHARISSDFVNSVQANVHVMGQFKLILFTGL